MKPTVYLTNHAYSRLIGGAFAVGAGADTVDVDPEAPILLPGPAICYGVLRGCGRIMRLCAMRQRDFYHIDLGYFNSHHFSGYYRVTKNAPQAIAAEADLFDPDTARFRALNLKMHAWRKGGRNVIFAPISTNIARFDRIGADDWCREILAEIALYTDRPVITKLKGEGTLKDVLADAYCLVTYSSNVAVEALFYGLPVIVLGPSAAAPLSWNWRNLESPTYPENRDELFSYLCNNQWTLEEFQDGTAWRALQHKDTPSHE